MAIIDFVECYSEPQYVQGARRDVLDFRFDAAAISLDEVDKLFTSDECSKLTIRETTVVPVQAVDTEGNVVTQEVERTEEFVHDHYGVRVALSKQFFTLATENGSEDVEQISVKMAQYTPVEIQIASLTETVDILVMDSLMA